MSYVFYMSKAEKGAINSGKEVQYFITAIDVQPHTHPLYIGRMIDENADSLGLGIKDGFYNRVNAIWDDHIDTMIEKSQKQADNYEPRKNDFPVQYYDAVNKVKELTEAKEIMEKGLVVNPFVE